MNDEAMRFRGGIAQPAPESGMERAPAHRFFFRPEEIEPLQRAPRVRRPG